MRIRLGAPADTQSIARLCAALWRDATEQEHAVEVAAILCGEPPSTLQLAIFVAEDEHGLAGFIEVGLRSHADGCDARRAVGFIEGWYVEPVARLHGLGRALLAAAEDWARAQGARELASDTWIDNEISQRAHEALGFEVVDRCVNYRKSLL